MLTAKGYDARFLLESGREVSGTRSAAVLHDSTGNSWPAKSALVLPFTRSGALLENKEAQTYFGSDYDLREGSVNLPPRSLAEWKFIGDVVSATYVREGDREGLYEHPFGRQMLFGLVPLPVARKKGARLYRLGKTLRLELGKDAVWDRRGIVD